MNIYIYFFNVCLICFVVCCLFVLFVFAFGYYWCVLFCFLYCSVTKAYIKMSGIKKLQKTHNKHTVKRRKEMFYLKTQSTHFIYAYMASDIWLRTILIVRKETRCRHIGYSFRLTARVLLYAPSHRQDSTYHGLYYTSCGALAYS